MAFEVVYLERSEERGWVMLDVVGEVDVRFSEWD